MREAERRLARGDHRGAYGAAKPLLDRNPACAGAAHVLGMIAVEHGNVRGAESLFKQAARAEPDAARHHAQLGRCLLAQNRQSEARTAADRAADLHPADAHTLDTLGVLYSRLGSHALALPLLRQAVERAPRSPSFRYNLGAAEQFAGELEAAQSSYRAAVALAPDDYRAWSALAGVVRPTPVDNLLAELERCRDVDPDDPERALHMGHALARIHEELGDPAAAMAALARGKAAKRAALAYDARSEAPTFDAAVRAFDVTTGRSGWLSPAPIFVVGLPRTGTTLVDRILSSHPDVASAGELSNFALLLKRMSGVPGPRVLDAAVFDRASSVDLRALGRAYVESVQSLVGGSPRFVDKMPLNVLYAGLIARALPQARIVCLRRHPLDAVLSNYRQLFATSFGYYGYAFDLADAAEYFVLFDRLVRRWRERLPADRFLELSYENLVADQEGETRRLLAFCGLDWDERCLDFHENAAPVATASAVQVRRPLYGGAAGRWRRYQPHLGPAIAVLEREGLLAGG